MMKFEEDEGQAGKGILLGNAWKDLPPTERGKEETGIFRATQSTEPRQTISRSFRPWIFSMHSAASSPET
jgi:hypothetical protein